ncbi:hypothetical protein ACTMU2_29625 [Cupriavidus basilensis]
MVHLGLDCRAWHTRLFRWPAFRARDDLQPGFPVADDVGAAADPRAMQRTVVHGYRSVVAPLACSLAPV